MPTHRRRLWYLTCRTVVLGITLVVAPIVVTDGQAFAKRPGVELGGFGGLVTAGGQDFNGTNSTTGVGAVVRLVFLGHFGLGIGLHYSDHGLQTLPEHIRIRSWYGEARFTQPLRSWPVSAFVGVRFGSAHEDISIVHWTADGGVAGGLAGFRWRIAAPIAIELEASETALHFDDRRGADGSIMPGTSSHGSSFGLDGGLVLAF